MKSRLAWQAAGERTYVLVLDAGEEAFSAITGFAGQNRLGGASLSAIGAFEAPPSAGSTWRPRPIGRSRWRSSAKA